MSIAASTVPDPCTHPVPDYGPLLRPTGAARLAELGEGLPEDHNELATFCFRLSSMLTKHPAFSSAAQNLRLYQRDGTVAKFGMFMWVAVTCDRTTEHYPVVVILHQDDQPDKTGICVAERYGHIPAGTTRFDDVLEAFSNTMEEVLTMFS